MSLILPRFTASMQRIDDERKIGRILLGAESSERVTKAKRIGNRSGEGDPLRLRGIPCIARGVRGASPGTNPSDAIR